MAAATAPAVGTTPSAERTAPPTITAVATDGMAHVRTASSATTAVRFGVRLGLAPAGWRLRDAVAIWQGLGGLVPQGTLMINRSGTRLGSEAYRGDDSHARHRYAALG